MCLWKKSKHFHRSKRENILIHYLSENKEESDYENLKDDKTMIKSA